MGVSRSFVHGVVNAMVWLADNEQGETFLLECVAYIPDDFSCVVGGSPIDDDELRRRKTFL